MPKQTTQDHKPKQQYGGWKKTTFHDLELPSGALAKVKRPGLQGLMKAGILDDLDTLTAAVVNETIPTSEGTRGQKKPPKTDPKAIADALEAVDKIVCYVVVEPRVLSSNGDDGEPIPEDERDPDEYYADDVDIEDKSFIVAFAMGASSSLDDFRASTASAVGGVPAGA